MNSCCVLTFRATIPQSLKHRLCANLLQDISVSSIYWWAQVTDSNVVLKLKQLWQAENNEWHKPETDLWINYMTTIRNQKRHTQLCLTSQAQLITLCVVKNTWRSDSTVKVCPSLVSRQRRTVASALFLGKDVSPYSATIKCYFLTSSLDVKCWFPYDTRRQT